MRDRIDADRKREIQDSLLSANAGCLLMFVLVVGLPLVGIGGFFVYLGLSTMRDQARLNDAVISVPATIVSSAVRRSTTKLDLDSTATSYWADVDFTFEYEGQTRDSDKVWPVGEGRSEADAQAIVERYPPGAQVSAFVDPKDPGTAFLEKRWSQMPYVSACIGCLPAAFVTALGILVAGWKRPGIALLSGVAVGAIVLFLLVLTGEHYLRHVPASERVWWTWAVLAGSCALALGPLAAMIKARRLSRLYHEAVAATPSDGAGS